MPKGAIFILIVVAMFPTLIMVALAVKLWEMRRAKRWPAAQGKVLVSRVGTTSSKLADRKYNLGESIVSNDPFVQYEFQVGEKKFRGNRITIGEKTAGFELEGILKRYPVGKIVTVYYDPADPRKSVLERDLPMGKMMAGFAAVMLFFVGGPLLAAAVYFNAVDLFKAQLARPERAPFVAASGGFGLLVLIFAFAFTRMIRKAARWPVVRGKVVSSGVAAFEDMSGDSGSSRTNYRSRVVYTYQVNNLTFRGDRTVMGVSTSSTIPGLARRTAAKYPVGAVVDVHYNPDAPGESVLNANSKWHYLLWMVAAAMLTLSWAVATGRM